MAAIVISCQPCQSKLEIKQRVGNVTSARAEARVTCLSGGRQVAPGWDEGTGPHRRKRAEEQAHAVRLTESSFHVIGRTAFGIPDQLNFRNSSVGKKREGRQGLHTAGQHPHRRWGSERVATLEQAWVVRLDTKCSQHLREIAALFKQRQCHLFTRKSCRGRICSRCPKRPRHHPGAASHAPFLPPSAFPVSLSSMLSPRLHT